ncbi:MAG: hypothetical protein ACJAT6_001900 [Akkermansiaceae bacterium]|jgi:hypothetical protein
MKPSDLFFLHSEPYKLFVTAADGWVETNGSESSSVTEVRFADHHRVGIGIFPRDEIA